MSSSGLAPLPLRASRRHDLFAPVLRKIDVCILWLEQRRWVQWHPLWLSIALAGVAVITACPDYPHFEIYSGSPWAAEAIEWKFRHPFEPIPVASFAQRASFGEAGIAEQLEKRSYRITIPLAANLTGAGPTAILIIQQLGAVLFLGLVVVQAQRVTGDRLTGIFFGVIFASSFIGQWGFVDLNNFDGISWLLVLLTLLGRSAAGVALLIFSGGFCDERVILGTPLIWLWHSNNGGASVNRSGWANLLSLDGPRSGLLLGVAAFVAGRLWLGLHWESLFNTSGMSISILKSNLLWLPLALVCILKGMLLLLVAAGLVSTRNASGGCLIGVLAWLPGLLAALLVYDLTRSLAYGFVAYFLWLRLLNAGLNLWDLRRLTFCAALISVAFPTYWILLRVYVVLPVLRLL